MSIVFSLFSILSTAQIITSDPVLPTPGQPVTIYYDATKGTAGLKDFTGDVYAHTGVITNESADLGDWKYVKTTWGVNTPETKLTRESANLYSLEIGPTIRDYYVVPTGETITHMAFVFRSADSGKEGKDDGEKNIFAEVFDETFTVSIIQPDKNLIIDPGETVQFEAATNKESDISLYNGETLIESITGTTITHSFVLNTAGDYWLRVTASSNDEVAADSVFIHVLETLSEVTLPDTLIDGINYIDDQMVQMVLYAPGKEHVFVIGDFNEWTPGSGSRMNRDGDRFWITLDNLEPGIEYAFQYLVDGSLTITDPYSEKVLDPWNDKWITEETYPGLKPYPVDYAEGITGVFQTDRPPYAWVDSGFEPPEQENLVIYELLLRDFLEAHDWITLTDTLNYFATLGINAIELMPVNEFEGNESWGYNPSFYFAADKYYGPAEDLKVFIDSCHQRGIAVIIDMVLNHSYGQSPLVRLYFDSGSGKVTADNPWYNVDSPNPLYAWGYDFDHESEATENFIDSVNHYWLNEFHVDGFRFDFTKGFTNTPGDGGAYDGARIAILKRMADEIWSINPETYIILEHFADNNEEKELSNHGMMLWGNTNYNYNEATMGYNENGKSDFSWISYKKRGWNEPHVVGYMESHDEERLMYKNITYGNSSGSYNIQERNTALERMELAGAFFFTIPGPKMIWQFGELGYDYSIDYDCRVCNKPIRWDYYETGLRRRVYQIWSALIDLKISEPAFESSDFNLVVSGAAKRIEINHADMDVRIIGNFDVLNQSVDPSFSRTGLWYNFFNGDSIDVTDPHGTISLTPGEYRLYTTKRLSKPEITAEVGEYKVGPGDFHVYPNPVTGMLYMEPVPENSWLTILNSAGQIVKILELEGNRDHVNLSSLPPGLYILSRQTGKEAPQYVKVIRE
ncbi:MAG: T9SS type A sorting domain-containing protein [Bacteroidales bacterium]|nr:T9SS type A sorting domain-containing protein [Bacteroidales bacterium]